MKLIDIGGFNGDSALHFISYPDIESIDVYEPNGDFKGIWDAITEHYPYVTFVNQAVYTYTGTIKFTKRPSDLPLGSTVMKSKSGWGSGDIIDVPCIDILTIVPNEPFCLKIDAEGAEYDILERLITSGKSDLIDRLYVEWHDTKMDTDNEQRQINITNHFGKRIKAWL